MKSTISTASALFWQNHFSKLKHATKYVTKSLTVGSEPWYERLSKETGGLRSNYPSRVGLQFLTSLKNGRGDPISLFWLKKLETALWGIPPGERFHYRDWGRAFVVAVVDNSQMPGLQSLLFPILHLCLFEVFHFQKIKQKTHSCKMPLPLLKLQLFQTSQSWFSLVMVKDSTILI